MSFYKDKRVVVTGGRGFVGSFLVDMLVEQEAQVTVMDTGVRGQNFNPFVDNVSPCIADVTNQGNCAATFRDADVVFNLAAHVGGLYYNIAHQAEMFWGNMQVLASPALAAAKVDVPVYLQVSTVCCYSAGFNNPALERWGHTGLPEQGNAGYAWAKRMGERLCHWAFEDAPTRYVIARPTNCFGPRDYFDDSAHVIPALIRKFTAGGDVVQVFGGEQQREFVYVEDLARGMLAVAEHGDRGGAYNLGTGGETVITIQGLAQMIQLLTDHLGPVKFNSDAPTGDFARSTDSSKAQALGWKYKVGLEEGLQRTIEWWDEQGH